MRSLTRLIGLLSLVAVLLAAGAGAAYAHATLESTSPGSGTVLAGPPHEVTATFDEAVGVSADSLRVLAPDGHLVSRTPTTLGDSPRQIRVGLVGGLGSGTYTVAWHVVSADSHLVSGAFTFSVGHPSRHVSAASVQVAGGGAVRTVYAVARGLAFLGYAVLAGGLLFVAWCWPAGGGSPRVRGLLVAGWLTTAIATVAAFVLQGVYAAGLGLSHLLEPSLLAQTWHGRAGQADMARLALLVVGLVLVLVLVLAGALTPPRRLAVGAPLLATALALTWPVADHASVGRLVPLTELAETVHLVAMAGWVGGLVVLLVAALRPAQPDGAGVVGRFSRLAGWYVVLVIVTGTFQTWRNVGHWAALIHTTYGLLVVAKILGIVVLVGLGALARRHLRHRLIRGRPRSGSAGRPPDLLALRRSVAVEAVVVVAILGVTAVLVETPTGRESYHPIVSATRPFDTGERSGTVAVTVDPAVVGPQSVRIRLTDSAGRDYSPAQVSAALTLPAERLGPLSVALRRTAPGRYLSVAVPVDVRGTWTLAVTVRSDAFDETTVEIPVPVG